MSVTPMPDAKAPVGMTSKTAEPAIHTKTKRYDLNDPALFINRELSLLEFNRRVLEEAQDLNNPIMERAKFLAIYSSNMDEFFMVRVAGLRQQIAAGVTDTPADGLLPTEQLVAIRKIVRARMKEMNACFDDIRAKLAETGIHLHHYNDLTKAQQNSANEYFKNEIFPVLTPLAFDPGRPFPHISSLSLNQAVLVREAGSGGEVVHLVVQDESRPRNGHLAAEERVDGRGDGNGVAGTVHDGEVGRLASVRLAEARSDRRQALHSEGDRQGAGAQHPGDVGRLLEAVVAGEHPGAVDGALRLPSHERAEVGAPAGVRRPLAQEVEVLGKHRYVA